MSQDPWRPIGPSVEATEHAHHARVPAQCCWRRTGAARRLEFAVAFGLTDADPEFELYADPARHADSASFNAHLFAHPQLYAQAGLLMIATIGLTDEARAEASLGADMIVVADHSQREHLHSVLSAAGIATDTGARYPISPFAEARIMRLSETARSETVPEPPPGH